MSCFEFIVLVWVVINIFYNYFLGGSVVDDSKIIRFIFYYECYMKNWFCLVLMEEKKVVGFGVFYINFLVFIFLNMWNWCEFYFKIIENIVGKIGVVEICVGGMISIFVVSFLLFFCKVGDVLVYLWNRGCIVWCSFRWRGGVFCEVC